MRRGGSRTADGWWLLLLTVLGWLLVSYGGQAVFGTQGGLMAGGQRHDVEHRQLQTTDVTISSPISVTSTSSSVSTTNTTKAASSPTNVATTLSSSPSNLAAILADEASPSPVSSPSPTPAATTATTLTPTPTATTAGTPAPTVASVVVATASPTASPSPTPSPSSAATPTPTPSPSPSPSPTTAATPAATAAATSAPTASPTPAATPATTVAATASPVLTVTPTPSATASPTPAPTTATVASPSSSLTLSPSPVPTASSPPSSPSATPTPIPTPIPTSSPTLSTTPASVATPAPTVTPASSTSPSPAAVVSPSPTPTPTLTPTASLVPSPTLTTTPSPSAVSPTPSPAVSASPSPVATPTSSPVVATTSPSPVANPTSSPSVATASPSPVATASPTPVATLVSSPVASLSPSPIATVSPSPAATTTPAPTATVASPLTAVATATPTPTPTPTAAPSPSPTASPAAATSPAVTAAATVTPTPAVTPGPSPTLTPTPTPTSSPVQLLLSTANTTATVSPSPTANITATVSPSPTTTNTSQSVSVPATAPARSSNINAATPSSVDVAPVPGTPAQAPSSNTTALAPTPSSSNYGSDPPTPAPSSTTALNASAPTPDAGSPATAPAAASPTAAVTAPVPAPAGLTTAGNSTAPIPAPATTVTVPAPSQGTAVPVPAPAVSVNAPVPAPGANVPVPAPGVNAPVPAPSSAIPVPAPAQGVPAPAPSESVAAPAPGTVIAANDIVLVPAPAVETPPVGAPTPSTLLTTTNASAQSPNAGSIAGIESSNTTSGVPGLAPTPSTAVASAVPTPAEAAPAVAPSTTTSSTGVPALAPVSSITNEYQSVANAPASWNSSAYSTATVQITVTNTSVVGFDTPTQTALLNALNSYLQAGGYSNFYMGLNGISGAVAVVQASPGAAAAAPAEGLPPGVSVSVVVTSVDNSTAATPLTAEASPTPARRLLADTVTSSGTGVDVNVTITAPASDLNNITALVSEAVSSGQVQQQLQAAGVNISLTRVNVEVVIAGLPGVITVPAVSSPSPVAVLPPSPPTATSKSAGVPIGAVAGGVAGGAVVIVGGGLLTCLVCKRRRRRRQWTKDLETAKAGYTEDPRGSSDSGSSGNSGRPGGLGRKVAAYMPFGTNSNESVDATPHAKHATMDDSFAGISRFKPDGTLKVNAARPQLISSAASGHQMGTIPERKSYSADADGVHLHDTANLLDSHSNNVQTAADHALLSPVSLFSFGTPVSRNGQASIVDPFRPIGMVSRPSEGKLSSDGSANLMRGGSGDQLLGAHASGDYSDRFLELAVEPIASRKGSNASGRQYSGNVDANLWSVAWKDLEIQKQIGEGSFGKVFLAKWRETTVAVKLLTYTGVSGSLEDNDEFFNQGMNVLLKGLEQEAGMMASMRHPNVVMYLGVCLQPPCVVTEYCARGSLNDVFKRARATPALAAQLDWGRRLNMVLDAAKGMMYLHSSEPPVIHRDLKSPNLLVDKHWRIKVCDFNLSRVMEESAILSSMAASNPRWLAPEILSGRGYTFSSDVYSFGVIMWEFLTWQIPWHECGPWQVVALVTEGAQRPELPAPEDLPGTGTFAGYSEYIMLMEQCWDQDPAARPTFAQVITVLRKMLAAEMRAKSSNNAELNPQKSASPSA